MIRRGLDNLGDLKPIPPVKAHDDAVVWIVQPRVSFTGQMKVDYAPAKEHGRLKFLLDPTDSALVQQPIILKLKRELIYFKKEDSLILTGSAALVGAAMVVVAHFNQWEVPVLYYDAPTHKYFRKIYKF